jgi:hypothetical protein
MQAQLNISKNLLPKIPQFWESPGTAFAELVQNAVRAGATEIHLTMDDEAGQAVHFYPSLPARRASRDPALRLAITNRRSGCKL